MKQQAGFSLTELIVVSAIVAILLAIGLPSYRYISNSSRTSSEINSLLGDLMYARSEAIREGQMVSVCVSTNGTTCAGATNTLWASGWIVFPDPTASLVPAAGSVLRVQTAFTGKTPDILTPSNPIGGIVFNREGFPQVAGPAAFPPGTIMTLHDPSLNPVWTRCLAISVGGQLQTETNINPPVPPCT